MDRVAGIETEYGCLVSNDESRAHTDAWPVRVKNYLFRKAQAGAIDLHYRDYEDVVRQVKTGASDETMVEWAFADGRRPSDKEITMWNEFMRKFGWRDEAAEILERRKREAGMQNRAEIETMFQFIDADEGRPVAGVL